MERFFDTNNPIMRFLSRLVDLAVLNLLTLACALPVVTMGASLTAMNYVMIHQVRNEETYITKMFFRSLKDNLRQGIGLGLIYAGFAAVAAVDLLALRRFDTKETTALMLFLTFVSVYAVALAAYSFGLLARFENTVRETLKNAARLSVGNLPRTMGMILVWVVWGAVLLYLHKAAPLAILLYGVSLPGYLCTLLYDPVFKKMEAGINPKSGAVSKEEK